MELDAYKFVLRFLIFTYMSIHDTSAKPEKPLPGHGYLQKLVTCKMTASDRHQYQFCWCRYKVSARLC
jgi:hypothetical protein